MQTRAIAILFPHLSRGRLVLSDGDEALNAATLSGVGRLLGDIAPAFLMCDPRDLGRVERVRDPHFGCPAIYFFDRYPGGTGLAEGLAALLARSVSAASERLAACGCHGGCPSCIGVDFSAVDGDRVKTKVKELLEALSFDIARQVEEDGVQP
jgi:DEAD/DEAH box helicase domain-containing protein